VHSFSSPTKTTYIYHYGGCWNGSPTLSDTDSSSSDEDIDWSGDDENQHLSPVVKRLVDYDISTDDEGDDD
jgi:hypothetical protein